MTDPESNKQTIERFYEAFYNRKDFAGASRFLGDDVVNRHAGRVTLGREAMINSFSRDVQAIFPNFHIKVRRLVAEADLVWTHGTISGLPGGNQVLSVDIWKLCNGKIVEHWDVQQSLKPDQDPSPFL